MRDLQNNNRNTYTHNGHVGDDTGDEGHDNLKDQVDDPAVGQCCLEGLEDVADDVDEKDHDMKHPVINNTSGNGPRLNVDMHNTDSTIPVDRGCAWMVLLSCFVMHLLIMGVCRSFGVFVEEFQDRFQVSTRELGLVAGMATMLLFGIGPFVHYLVVKFSARRVVIAGSLLTSMGVIATAFVPSFGWVYITYGLIAETGVNSGSMGPLTCKDMLTYCSTKEQTFIYARLGCGLSFNPPNVMLGRSFDKYRPVAFGLAVSGGGLGAFFIPNLARLLIKEYTLKGCLLILGALVLNVCACGVLLPSRRSLHHNRSTGSGDACIAEDKEEQDRGEQLVPNSKERGKANKKPSDVLDWSLMKQTTFILHLISSFFGFMCNINNLFMIAVYTSACGHSRDTAALVLSVMGVSDLLGRITFQAFSTVVKCRRRTLMACCLALMGILNMAVPYMTELPSLMTYVIVFGYISGSCMSTIPVLCAETNGPEKMGSAFGFTTLAIGIAVMIGPPTCGAINDITGSWDLAFVSSGIFAALASVSAFLESFMERTKLPKPNNIT